MRWPNLLMIAFMQYLIRFFITESLGIPHVLDHLHYFYGVLCSVSLAAGGYIINDIYDQEVDTVNKPKRKTIGTNFSTATAWQFYFGTAIIALYTGYMISKASGFPSLWMLPLVAIAILYFYATSLKKIAVIGNITVSFLTALPVILVALFDLIPAITSDNQDVVKAAIKVITAYSLFAFWSNLIREIVKDAEDLDGDKKYGYKTLAVILGKEQIRYIILILTAVLLCFTGFYNLYLSNSDLISTIYILFFVNIPLLYFAYLIIKARKARDFKKASTLIKIIMLTAILSMVIFTLSINLSW